MRLPWKSFQIDLSSFSKYLIDNIPAADGIVADETGLTIIEKEPFDSSIIQLINNHYNLLNEQDEFIKINRPVLLKNSIAQCKSLIVNKSYDDLSVIEKKLLIGVDLSSEDENELIGLYG